MATERDQLQKILGSEARLKTLIKKELLAVAEKFGDERRSPLAAREEAKAFSELELVSADPMTVVMSEKGWIRGAKGHEIDPTSLSYKSGDGFKMAVRGRSNQPAVILDSTGRAYTVPATTCPQPGARANPSQGVSTPLPVPPSKA